MTTLESDAASGAAVDVISNSTTIDPEVMDRMVMSSALMPATSVANVSTREDL